MAKNKLLLLLPFILCSCNNKTSFLNSEIFDIKFLALKHDDFRPNILQAKRENFNNLRSLSSNDDICLEDKNDLESIIAENTNIEGQSRSSLSFGDRFTLNIGGVNYDVLREQEKIYLKKYKDYINTDANFVGCTTLGCILNRSMNLDDNSPQGYLYYNFYLRTGYAISTKLVEPANSVTETPSNMNLNEAKVARIAGLMFPNSMKYLSSVDSMFYFDKYLNTGSGSPAAGLSTGHYVYVTNLDGVDFSNLKNTYLIQIILHEFGHKLDSSFGQQAFGSDFSDKEEWKSYSGWGYFEGLNKQRYGSTWALSQDKEGFVSEYASTNPAEDFAETVAEYRYRPELAFEKTPWKFKKMKERFFDGVSYRKVDLIPSFSNDAKTTIYYSISKIIESCLINTTQFSKSKFKITYNIPIDENIKNCINENLLNVYNQKVKEQKFKYIEGCTVYKDNEEQMMTDVAEYASKHVNKFLASSETYKLTLSKINEAKEFLAKNLDAGEVYLSCLKANDKENCYNETLDKVLADLVSKNSSIANDLQIEFDNFKINHSFIKTMNEVKTLYNQDQIAFINHAENYFNKLWAECKEKHEDSDAEVPITPFDFGSTYISSSFQKCLNKNFDDKITENFPIKNLNENHMNFIKTEYLIPYIKNKLVDAIAKSASEEKTIREFFTTESVDKIRKLVLSDENITKGENKKDLCISKTTSEFEKITKPKFKFTYLNDILNQITLAVCENIESITPSVQPPTYPTQPSDNGTISNTNNREETRFGNINDNERTFKSKLEVDAINTTKDDFIGVSKNSLRRNKISKQFCKAHLVKYKAKIINQSQLAGYTPEYTDLNAIINTWFEEICSKY